MRVKMMTYLPYWTADKYGQGLPIKVVGSCSAFVLVVFFHLCVFFCTAVFSKDVPTHPTRYFNQTLTPEPTLPFAARLEVT